MVVKDKKIEKVYSSYVSEYHLEMILVPFINSKIEEKENRKSTVRPGMFRGFLEVRCRTSLPPRPVWLFL